MQSAFDTDSLSSVPIEFTAYDDSGSFRSSEVMSSSASTDHPGIGAGVDVDLPVLQSSVSVHYDKDVIENRNSNKASVTMSSQQHRLRVLILETVQMGTPEFQTAINKGRGIFQRARGLDDSVAKTLKEIGVRKGRLATREQCAQLCGRAVVVELLWIRWKACARYDIGWHFVQVERLNRRESPENM
ncbi:hypothetical protein ACQKWADRAFT_315830 [Trichoderma austrokoningii]